MGNIDWPEAAVKQLFPDTADEIKAACAEYFKRFCQEAGCVSSGSIKKHISSLHFNKYSRMSAGFCHMFGEQEIHGCDYDRLGFCQYHEWWGFRKKKRSALFFQLADSFYTFINWNYSPEYMISSDQAAIYELRSSWRVLLAAMLNGADAFSIKMPFWPWDKCLVRAGQCEILFPANWPNSKSISQESANALSSMPEARCREIIACLAYKCSTDFS